MSLNLYPVFPLQVVTFPGHTLPLRLFESRYLQMLVDVAETRCFVVALIRSGPEVGGEAMPYPVGTLVDFSEVIGEGGSKRIQAVGRCRVYLQELIHSGRPYLQAQCQAYADHPWSEAVPKVVNELEAALLSAAEIHAPGTEDGVLATLTLAKDLLDAENFSLFLSGCLALPPPYRQRFLEAKDPVNRMQQALHFLSQARVKKDLHPKINPPEEAA
jgi:uncharacterized protein